MNMPRRLKIFVLTATVGLFGLEAGTELSIPGVSSFVIDRRGEGWPATHACQRRRRGAAHDTALRGRRVQLLDQREQNGLATKALHQTRTYQRF